MYSYEDRIRTVLAGCRSDRAETAVPAYPPLGQREGSVNAILTALAQEAGGADFLEIKRQGGWRHDGTVHGYIEEARAFEEDAAGSLLRRKLST